MATQTTLLQTIVNLDALTTQVSGGIRQRSGHRLQGFGPRISTAPIVGLIGHGVTYVGIMGSDTANTGDMIAQSVATLIFGVAAIAVLTFAARSTPQWRGDLG